MEQVFAFLNALEQNNSREWFQEHRAEYEAARKTFRQFVAQVITAVSQFEPLEGLEAGDCLFRLHRDVRFSNDKRPYKTNFAAVIAPGGRKTSLAPYYLHLAPHQGTFTGGGLYMPSAEQLKRVRQAVAESPEVIEQILNKPDFRRHFPALEGEQLKTAPKGYAKDHPQIEWLRYKQWLVTERFSDAESCSPDFAERVTASFRTLQPFLDWLNAVAIGRRR